MISFYSCENRFTELENSQKKLDELVTRLNKSFGNKNCPNHLDEEWSIGVDLLKNGSLQFHQENQKRNGCNFATNILDNEVFSFLKTENKFPLI